MAFVLPLPRSVTFGMPPIYPTAISMPFEFGTYACCGCMWITSGSHKKMELIPIAGETASVGDIDRLIVEQEPARQIEACACEKVALDTDAPVCYNEPVEIAWEKSNQPNVYVPSILFKGSFEEHFRGLMLGS